MVGDSPLSAEENSDVNVRGVTYEGSDGLLEILTETNIDWPLVTPYDMRSYKSLLNSLSGHLRENLTGRIKTIQVSMHRDII